jgi:aryl-alcohol dehydrogenase-like predicted oxidoreductase
VPLTGGLPTRIGLGTAPISSHRTAPHWWGPQDRDTAVAAVRAAVAAGVGWIDTAPMYGWGRAEEIVAEALGDDPDRPLVLTKCGTLRADDGSFYTDNSPAALRRDVEGSLRRLGVERLDLVQVHDEDPSVPIEETWGALHDLVREGSVGAVGLSNHRVELLDRALAVGQVATVQNQYSLLDRSPEADGTLRWCARHEVTFMSWGSLGAGFLADGFDVTDLDPDDLRHRLRWAGADAALTARTREAAAAIASRHGCTMVAVALAWLTTRPFVFPIVGARTPIEAIALVEPLPVLDSDERALLDRLPAATTS